MRGAGGALAFRGGKLLWSSSSSSSRCSSSLAMRGAAAALLKRHRNNGLLLLRSCPHSLSPLRSFATERLMKYRSGAYHLAVDLPSTKERVTFSFLAQTPVEAVLKSLKEEGAATAALTASSTGTPISGDTTLEHIASTSGRFCLDVGDGSVPVVMTHGVEFSEAELEGTTSLPSLLHKAKIVELRALLSEDPRRSMPLVDFASLCRECGIPEDQVEGTAGDLHRAGSILHFVRDQNLKDVVYLRPEEVIEDIFSGKGLCSPMQRHIQRRIALAYNYLASAKKTLEPLEALQKSLEEVAEARVTRRMWGVTGGLVAGSSYYFYLVYASVGWDVMEPVTYFTAAGISTLGFAWWMMTNHDHEHEGMRSYFRAKAVEKEYKRRGFSVDELEKARESVQALEREVKLLKDRSFTLSAMGQGVKHEK